MYDRDAVIRHAAEAASNQAVDVHTALSQFVRAVDGSEALLRDALVAQAAGFEATAHDGATFDARVSAAKHALAAWDGPADWMVTLSIGTRRIRCHIDLARRAGWGEIITMPDGSRVARENGGILAASVPELAQALGEGLDGDDAMLRTIVLRAQTHETNAARFHSEKVAADEAKAAGMTLAAERERTKARAKAGA